MTKLKSRCERRPEDDVSVVVAVKERAEHLSPSLMGLVNAEEIPYQAGMYKLKASGAEVLALAERDDIESIDEDTEVQAL